MEAGFIVDGRMSKRQRKSDNGSEKDHISDLPDCLISNILSRLSARYAVRTSALSRDWKSKWTSIFNIYIRDNIKAFEAVGGIAIFNSVITRILIRSQNSRLRGFRVSCDSPCHNPCDLETWISSALARKVQKLSITASRVDRLDSPWCFSGWNTLVKLKLEISCTLKVAADNCFPNLKKLRLVGGKDKDIKIMSTKRPGSGYVVLSFPVLEALRLHNCEWLDVDSVEIKAPELLLFSSCCSLGVKNYEIKIRAPKLVMFALLGNGPVNNYILSAPAVTYVDLYNRLANITCALRAYEMLTEFSNLKCLEIRGKALQALLCLKTRGIFATFNQIKELVVNFSYDIKDVLDLLQVLPPLESLILDVRTLDYFIFGETLTHKICSQLKEVRLLNFSETKGQHDLATCLLEKAKNLKKMTIHLRKNALNSKNSNLLILLHGKPSDILEVDVPSLLSKGASCELVVVEQKDYTPRPNVKIGNGNLDVTFKW